MRSSSLASSIAERSQWDREGRNRWRIENADGTACLWASSIADAQADLAMTPGGRLVDEWEERSYVRPIESKRETNL